MTKILVKKSAPKGVLVKQVQPQLMQMPKGGKSFMDFARTTFAPKNRQDIGVKQRLAGLAGMAGKIGAGLSTVNQTMQSMQGGNLSAPLSAGYTFEAADPTGRMISDMANPSQKPKPTVQADLPKTGLVRGRDLPANIRQQVEERKERERLLNQMANPASGSAMDQMNQRRQQLEAQDRQRNEIYTQNLPQMTPEHRARQQAYYNSVLQGMPTPASTPIPPQPPLNVDPLHTIPTSNEVSTSNALPPNMSPVPTNPLPPLPSTVSQPAAPQPMQPTAAPQPMQPTAASQPATQSSTQYSSVPPNLLAQQKNMGQYMQQNHLMTDPDAVNRSFVTALTEKLGADIVYKMTPHQIGTFAAYTLLKLR